MILHDQHERVGKWVAEKTDGGWIPGTTAIGLEKDGKIVAGAMYEWFNGASACLSLAIETQYVPKEFLRFVFEYPFDQLKAKTLIGLVSGKNFKSRNLDEHLGFELNSVIPDAHPDGALFIYTLKKEDCKWINHEN